MIGPEQQLCFAGNALNNTTIMNTVNQKPPFMIHSTLCAIHQRQAYG